ncbi:MAG: MoxR family ATPase [Bdellovibrionales bacterium]|nr:MoxR family ATPase [Bdellovibrionales bacterium]
MEPSSRKLETGLELEGQEFRDTVVKKIGDHIIGQTELIERVLIALLAGGHLLLEGVPGLAKTKLLAVVSSLLNVTMKRVQFTPDLLPADILGTELYQPNSGTFKLRKGPIFANILLADEINRAPAKVQSALLQAMQERFVTIGEETLPLPSPFFVLATQNPIEQEGTYPLPEAQLDRFLFKVIVRYPSYDEEMEILERVGSALHDPPLPEPTIEVSELQRLSERTSQIFVDPKIDELIVQIVHATRNPKSYGLEDLIEWGASPRAGLALKRASRALALLRGMRYVTPEIVHELAPDVLRHRILLSFEAEARAVTADDVIQSLLKSIAKP